jgi:pyrimidine operon attenuation protein / uracil phosphoribosyltransferase
MEYIRLLESPKFDLTIKRLCYQIIENHNDFSNSAILGIQPRGIHLSERIVKELKIILPGTLILHGLLDNTFYRDDFRRGETVLKANPTQIEFLVENKNVILMDDVLYTGRTVRASLDALLAFGRPSKVELLTLVDRRFSRDLPIEPNYIGIQVDSRANQKVKVSWKEANGEDSIVLITESND